MSSVIPAVSIPAAVLGAQVAATQVGPVAGAADATLPFTGIAVGLYLTVALVLIISGFILRFLASRPSGQAARPTGTQ